MAGDQYTIEVTLLPEGGSPTPRQIEALFERIDEATLRTAIVLGSRGSYPQDPASMRREARFVLLKDEAWPRVTSIEFGSPFTARITTVGAARAAIFATAVAIAIGATADVVAETDRLAQNVDHLVQTIQELGDRDPGQHGSRSVLRGRGIEPLMDLSEIKVTPRLPKGPAR